ncbi:GNAT family N-acetyltransferase [Pseudomonas cannabina pv. alisalensis]|uniref:N-acetyltransferase domain-containing protein n=1 Tax=Pseudomonas syringae pv. maculicola str. ES4326 TaxID=629265 RepID=A0A8T8C3J3_PSEYM|nr:MULTISPECIES: hypothetical protein [Pseudomonas syringae group]QHE97954.1 hypothetical protein PMA4326_016000 [Pseudomonas syringae pv. maculicola str. ES4326]UBY98627.1 GNAT family N-acetyltransferase [Pseudomonas cannabina pv. alisalensis]
MISELCNLNTDLDNIMHGLITGWAKSRGGSGVSVEHASGISHCFFEYSIGKNARNRETFCWGTLNCIDSIIQFHKKKYHFLSVFDIDIETHKQLLLNGYKLVARETHMYKAIPDNVHSPNFSVKRVSSKEEADWYNSQKESSFIKPEHIVDPDVFDFYTRDRDIMTSSARAIRVGRFWVVDDVQTHPAFRRRGMASNLLVTITSFAQMDKTCILTLISSSEGLPLYVRDGYIKGLSLNVYSSTY